MSAAAAQQIGNLLAATLGNRARAGLILERLEGRADHVVRVGRADRLGHHVGDAQALEHGAHRAARDDAGAGGRRAQEHLGDAVTAAHVVMQRAALADDLPDHPRDLLRHVGCPVAVQRRVEAAAGEEPEGVKPPEVVASAILDRLKAQEASGEKLRIEA